MSTITVLCVDPDEATRAETADALGGIPDAVTIEAGSLGAAENAIDNHPVDALVTEYELPDGTGLDLLEYVRETAPDIGCILYTATGREAIDTTPFQELVIEYVAKDTPDAEGLLRQVVQSTATLRIQTAYPLPETEPERLEALDRYDLDTDALRVSVGRLTRLAREHFDVPISSINVITEHNQEFLVCSGADWTPGKREDSVCTHTIVEETPVMVIEDVSADPRFEMIDEDIYGFDIRFYAGAKLTTAEGYALGTFCIYDDEPRALDDDGRDYLRTLAEVAMDLFELHRRTDAGSELPTREGK